MKLITFAVPCYNSAEYMEKCINSLLKAGNEAEIIIVNDGSTKDNTKEIADRYASEYPQIVKAVHKENGGHGDACNTGLKNATGKYFKVVDSDDWVDEQALKVVMDRLRSFDEEIDCVLVNYVYEHVYNNTQRRVDYKKECPVNRKFTFEETKRFDVGKFITMHSLIYRTKLLQDIGLELPKHTFYVDNVLIYQPLPFVKNFYYIDVDFYRYFIGRPDQSVAEDVIMKRIDQHIRVTKIIIECFDLNSIMKVKPKLYRYMLSHLSILMTINSIYLIKIGTLESYQKKSEIWKFLEEKDQIAYKKCKQKFVGIASSENKFVCELCKGIYVIARKIFKFN
ncbi:MAG: glycosyltransferase family 2 protein [Clostridiales bacterium]|nr:glycosyltransferase family 2 protein [Clostridiales bacterium]